MGAELPGDVLILNPSAFVQPIKRFNVSLLTRFLDPDWDWFGTGTATKCKLSKCKCVFPSGEIYLLSFLKRSLKK